MNTEFSDSEIAPRPAGSPDDSDTPVTHQPTNPEQPPETLQHQKSSPATEGSQSGEGQESPKLLVTFDQVFPGLSDFAREMSFLLAQTYLAIKRNMDNDSEFARFEVTPGQLHLLHELVINGGRLAPSELSEKTFRDRREVTGMLDRLERREMVARERSVYDRREIQIRITEKGYEVHSLLVKARTAVLERCLHGLSQAERDELRRMLLIIFSNAGKPKFHTITKEDIR